MRLFFLIVLSILSLNVFGQDFDKLMVKKQLDCSDISYNCARIFEDYYSSNKLDSAQSILTYWQAKCGIREPLQRCKILLAIKQNCLNDSVLTDNMFYYIFNYKNRIAIEKSGDYESYDNYQPYYGYIPVGQEFDKFSKKAFSDLQVNYTPKVIEYLLCEFYGNNPDTLFTKLQTNTYKETRLAKEYNKLTESYVKLPEYHVAWITGLWVPTGGIKSLGVHPDLGFMSGIKYKKFSFDMTLTFKFLDTPESYLARRLESSVAESTNHFFGGYIGFDIGRDIFSKNNHEVQLMGGVAFDGFDALEEDLDIGLKSASTAALNLNLGLGYRYYLKNDGYLGLRVKYNFVNYASNHVIDFTGNPLTIQFVIGGLTNDYRKRNLKALEYNQR